jgi:ParB family chromosome partitioning protein
MPTVGLPDAAAIYKVYTDAIALKVKQEFAAKVKAKNLGNRPPPPLQRQRKWFRLHPKLEPL